MSEPAAAELADDVLDEALERLQAYGPESAGGLSNHGPMAVEALMALGQAEHVPAWVRAYERGLERAPSPWQRIARERWREALGRARHVGDWPAFFEAELAAAPWREVLDTWLARLAPGFASAAAHGVIRVAHAVRALAARETPVRQRELAHALGYWATSYRALPGADDPMGAERGALSIDGALATLPRLPEHARRPGGLISTRLEALADWPVFVPTLARVDLHGAAEDVLARICRAATRAYLADDGRELFAFVHAVTGPSALRLLLPHLSPAVAQRALREAWRTLVALHVAFSDAAGPPPGRPSAARAYSTPAALAQAAAATGDEHAIKFTEVCLREHAVLPDDVFLEAAHDVCRRFQGAR